jgi:hypothetical protein
VAQAAGGLPPIFPEHPTGLLHAVVFDDHCEAKEVRAYPVADMPATRHRLPWLIAPGSDPFKRALERGVELSNRLGSTLQVRDSYGVVEVK